jgi:hypothetical protein
MAKTKYTEEFVSRELNQMILFFRQNPDKCFLEDFLIDRPYSPQRFSEWSKKYAQNQVISEAITNIKEILEFRCVQNALSGNWHAKLSIFYLKNVYGWK